MIFEPGARPKNAIRKLYVPTQTKHKIKDFFSVSLRLFFLYSKSRTPYHAPMEAVYLAYSPCLSAFALVSRVPWGGWYILRPIIPRRAAYNQAIEPLLPCRKLFWVWIGRNARDREVNPGRSNFEANALALLQTRFPKSKDYNWKN